MTPHDLATIQAGRNRPAFSLAEAVVAIAIVGVMLVAALQTVALARQSQFTITDASRGVLLAQELMTEILAQAYEDPQGADIAFGPGLDELATGDRSLFDDVDDYNGWTASPPQQQDGTALAGLERWERSVEVVLVSSANLQVGSAFDTGLKRVTVTVRRAGRVTATLMAIRGASTAMQSGQGNLGGGG